jgi:hypothetical protein
LDNSGIIKKPPEPTHQPPSPNHSLTASGPHRPLQTVAATALPTPTTLRPPPHRPPYLPPTVSAASATASCGYKGSAPPTSSPIVSGSKCRHFLIPWRLVKSTRYWKLLDRTTGCLDSSWVEEGGGLGRQVVKSCLPISTIMGKRDNVDCSRVQFFLGW